MTDLPNAHPQPRSKASASPSANAQNRTRQRLVIDTDTASDDAVALVMALMNAAVRVELITVVAGNVPLDLAVNNALVTLEICRTNGSTDNPPVYAGADRPLQRELQTAQFVHGEDGMGDFGLAKAVTASSGTDAVSQLIAFAKSNEGDFDLVTLGPLTNIALALQEDPLLLTRVRHTYLMAGAPDNVGNVNRLGEFNVWCDPEAAAAVFAAPGAKTMIGWNVSRLYAVMTPADQNKLPTLGPLGAFVHQINRVVNEYCLNTGLPGYDLPDPIAMSIAIDPSVVRRSTVERLRIHTTGTDERGWSEIVNTTDDATGVPLTIVWEADELAFKDQVFRACSQSSG